MNGHRRRRQSCVDRVREARDKCQQWQADGDAVSLAISIQSQLPLASSQCTLDRMRLPRSDCALRVNQFAVLFLVQSSMTWHNGWRRCGWRERVQGVGVETCATHRHQQTGRQASRQKSCAVTILAARVENIGGVRIRSNSLYACFVALVVFDGSRACASAAILQIVQKNISVRSASNNVSVARERKELCVENIFRVAYAWVRGSSRIVVGRARALTHPYGWCVAASVLRHPRAVAD